jgi:hypothetical protein
VALRSSTRRGDKIAMRVTSAAIGVVFLLPAKQCKFSLWFLGIYIHDLQPWKGGFDYSTFK